MSTFLDRLKQAMAASNKSKTDLWKACEISSGAVSQWFSKPTTQLKGKNLLLVAKELGVRPEWLATGDGDPKPLESDPMNEIFGVAENTERTWFQRLTPISKTITFKDETSKIKRSIKVDTWVGNEVTTEELEKFVSLLYEMRPEFRRTWLAIGEPLADPHGRKIRKDESLSSSDVLVSSSPELTDESKQDLKRTKK